MICKQCGKPLNKGEVTKFCSIECAEKGGLFD